MTMENLTEWLRPELIWFLVGVILFVVEIFNPGLIIGFFGIGAWLTALACALADIGLTWQLLIFLIASLVCVFLFRRRFQTFFEKRFKYKSAGEDVQDYVGRKVKVIQAIDPPMPGKIEVNGVSWSAVADVPVGLDAVVEITGRDNLTFKVKPIDVNR
jgi:membrane protein implicated in regulation of membrane protease activity